MERWVAVIGDGVGADADEFSGAAGGVVDDGGAEGTEWAGRGEVVEGLDRYSHPLFSDGGGYRCGGFLSEDGLVVLVLVLVAMAVGCCEGCCESQEDGLYEHIEFVEC